MKVRKFIGRDRKTSGLATGTLLCHLSMPAIAAKYDRHFLAGNPARAIEKVRYFVERHLPKSLALQRGASFVIQAEVRASGGGLRRKRLAKWTFGDELETIFVQASQAWEMFEFEEDYTTIEGEINSF